MTTRCTKVEPRHEPEVAQAGELRRHVEAEMQIARAREVAWSIQGTLYETAAVAGMLILLRCAIVG